MNLLMTHGGYCVRDVENSIELRPSIDLENTVVVAIVLVPLLFNRGFAFTFLNSHHSFCLLLSCLFIFISSPIFSISHYFTSA